MLDEQQLSELLTSISNKIRANPIFLPIVGRKNRNGIPYILVTESGYSFCSQEYSHIDFEEHNLDQDELIYRVFLLISSDMYTEDCIRGSGYIPFEGSVKIQREKWFQYQIEFLGRIDQSYSKRITDEIEKIKEKYPL